MTAPVIPPKKQRNLLEFFRFMWESLFDPASGAIKTTAVATITGGIVVNPSRGTSAPQIVSAIDNTTWTSVDITSSEEVSVRGNSDGIGFYVVVGMATDTPATEFSAGRYYELAPATFNGSGNPTAFEEKVFPTDGQERMWFQSKTGTGNSVFINKVVSP